MRPRTTVLEGDETVTATIQNVGGVTIGTNANATATITNDDTAPQYQITVSPASVAEG